MDYLDKERAKTAKAAILDLREKDVAAFLMEMWKELCGDSVSDLYEGVELFPVIKGWLLEDEWLLDDVKDYLRDLATAEQEANSTP